MDKERSGERMKLGAFFHPTGNHVAAWLHPDAQIDAGTNFRHYAEITQTAERCKFDLMFVADAVATRDGKLEEVRFGRDSPLEGTGFEPSVPLTNEPMWICCSCRDGRRAS